MGMLAKRRLNPILGKKRALKRAVPPQRNNLCASLMRSFTKIELSSLAVVAVMWILCAFESQRVANRRRLPTGPFPLLDDAGKAITDEEGKVIPSLAIDFNYHMGGYYLADWDEPCAKAYSASQLLKMLEPLTKKQHNDFMCKNSERYNSPDGREDRKQGTKYADRDEQGEPIPGMSVIWPDMS